MKTRINPYKTYKIGNGLRGNITFKARSIKEAWTKGCAKFNRWCPSEGTAGRAVFLELLDETKITLTTPWSLAQNALPKKKRHYCNHAEFHHAGFRLVAYGSSKEELVF